MNPPPENSSHNATNSDAFTYLNDVSRMSCFPDGTPVSRIFHPRCEADVVNILQSAHHARKQVGIRGTKHSMGGHSICHLGWEIDTKYLRHIKYDKYDSLYNRCVVRCGPGCQWADLIKSLNYFGKSPRTMQSYCTFSVGGTLAVNAHGITTDYCFAESVLEFRLARVNSNGKAEVVTCCRPEPGETTRNDEFSLGNELFGLVLGGYGMFGVITEVVLKVEDNVHLELDSMQLNIHSMDSSNDDEKGNRCDFVRIYDNCRQSAHNGKSNLENSNTSLGTVEIKMARLNTINLSKVSLYVLRRSSHTAAMSDLPAAPKEMSPTSQLLYKWILPLYKKQRYEIEEKRGEALDWNQDDSLTRNQLLFESAVPLTKLYEPLVKKDDTFVLQEFFCPHDKFSQWIKKAQPIYNDIESQQTDQCQNIILLNTTIRYVEEDTLTFLRYSRSSGGVYAFVLYYRIKRENSVERQLGEFHNRFAEVTLDLGGTFYLPYRKCYSQEMLKTAYPMIEDFAKKKEELDPNCMFSNLWFDHYILPLCSMDYQRTNARYNDLSIGSCPQHTINITIDNESQSLLLPKEEFWKWLPRNNNSNILRRNNSYRSLLRSKKLRDEFRDQFLVNIFNIADANDVMRVMTMAAWDPANSRDIHIYQQIFDHFHGKCGIAASNKIMLMQYWRGIQQIRRQKDELTRQTVNVLSNLGMLRCIHNYVCVGDHGKIVTELVNKLHMTGKIWVVHNSPDINELHDVISDNSTEKTMPSIATVLERGSLESVAHEEIAYDYISQQANEKLSRIPSETIDLVTMNQGLHHIPLDKLFDFLSEIHRILRHEGVFIIREHDLKISEEETRDGCGKCLYPMLDLAHSIFNAVTGVVIKEEEEEIRAFRPILEWRAILEKIGFVDTLVYEVEKGDPTWDEMLTFYKPCPRKSMVVEPVKFEVSARIIKNVDPPIMTLLHTFLSQIPKFVVSNMHDALICIKRYLPQVHELLLCFLQHEIPLAMEEMMVGAQGSAVLKQITDFFKSHITASSKQWIDLVDGLLSLISQSEVRAVYNFRNMVNMSELFLILPYLEKKVLLNRKACAFWEVQLVTFIKDNFPALFPPAEEVESGQGDVGTSTCIQNNGCSGNGYTNNNEVISNKVKGTEVEAVFQDLAKKIPGILDSEKMLTQSGFTLPQQVMLVKRFGGKDLPTTCEAIAGYLNLKIWIEIKEHLQAAGDTGKLPTKALLLSPTSKQQDTLIFHPWHFVFKTFLKAPNIEINRQGIFALRMMGMDEISALYKAAKKEEENNTAIFLDDVQQLNTSLVSRLQGLDHTFSQIGQDQLHDIEEKTIVFDSGIKRKDLFNVAEVIEAKFGYISATSRLVDITQDLQSLHSQIHIKLASRKHNDGTRTNEARVGWLAIHEDQLIKMRNNHSDGKRAIDLLRKNVVGISTLGLAGTNRLKIKYRRLTGVHESHDNMDKVKSTSIESCEVLASSQLINEYLHPDDGEYTWFKLNEWMQVEILDQLVSSLEHTPWYRFPFIQFIRIYFDVFKKQAKIIQGKYGVLTAYGSMAFLTDFIPGVVMSVLFGQLRLLAIPLLAATSNQGYGGTNQSRFLEQCVLRLQLQNVSTTDWVALFRKEVDPRILSVSMLPHNFFVLSTPPFKVMGEILQKVAIRFPSARLLQISNQNEIQVRIILSPEESIDLESLQGQTLKHSFLQAVLRVQGVKYMMQYQYPNTKQCATVYSFDERTGDHITKERMLQNEMHYCFEVQCVSLLDLIRTCEGIACCRVEQIYDFWN